MIVNLDTLVERPSSRFVLFTPTPAPATSPRAVP